MSDYGNKIITTCGTFTNGSSIEISADAPLLEPFAVYLQGGVNFYSSKIAVKFDAKEVLKFNTQQ